MPRGQTRYYPGTRIYKDLYLNLVCHRSRKGKQVILITNQSDLKEVLALYCRRWPIETAFGFFIKSRGLNFGDTHITHANRLHLLLGLLV